MQEASRRTLLKGLAAAGVAAPFLSPVAALAQAAVDPVLASIHPDLREGYQKMRAYAGVMPPFDRGNLAAIRRGMARFAPPPRAGVPWEKRTIPGGRGQPDVTVFVINGRPDGARPAILHTHGGGFIAGSAESSIRAMQDICTQLDCVAVSVEYRLAPEADWRASVDDTHAALLWLHANAPALGADPDRIGLLGESAGGGHAALLAIAARDRGQVPVRFQCLVYPMLDDRTGSARRAPAHLAPVGWRAADNRFGWESFLGMAPGTRRVPAAAVPARIASLAGLPPAWIGVGGLDLFVDEDIEYARRLNAAGVPAELIVVPGAFHGFDEIPGARVSSWFTAAKLDALRRGLGIARS